MSKKQRMRVVRSLQQLDSIVRNNTLEKVNQMIENDELIWDQNKYTVIPIHEEPPTPGPDPNYRYFNLSLSGSLDANKDENRTMSGMKASFQMNYVLELNDSLKKEGLSEGYTFPGLNKMDQLLADGYELKGIREESLSISMNARDYGNKRRYNIAEFENKEGSTCQIVSDGHKMIQMSYKQMLSKQQYAAEHAPQWVNDASQFAKDTGWDKEQCTELFRMMATDQNFKDSMPYRPGNQQSVFYFAQDYKEDIHTMIRGISKSVNWHNKPDTGDSFSTSNPTQYDINHEMNECGKRRTYDAFAHTTSNGNGTLMSTGKTYYSDSINTWRNFNVQAAQTEMRGQMTSITQYRKMVNDLPEKNIGKVASVLGMKKEIVDFIAKEGTVRDMQIYLSDSDQTMGKKFFCPKELAAAAYETVQKHQDFGTQETGFNRSDIISTAGMIHHSENYSEAEKKVLLSAAIENIYQHGREGIAYDKTEFSHMLRSESLETIQNFLTHNKQSEELRVVHSEQKKTSPIKVVVAPSRELAESYMTENEITATVEAEYGDYCIEGKDVTLAHHGSRSQNPAPCNTPDIPTLSEGTILLSHVDLDSIGGVLGLMGMKKDDQEFWKGAEFIDVKGPHHMNELSQKVQDQLNAYYAWNSTQPKIQLNLESINDITDRILKNADALNSILDERALNHNEMIQAGRDWRTQLTERVESKLVAETQYARCFITDETFCSSGYYSPSKEMNLPATVVLNIKDHSILVSFFDSEKNNSRDFVQALWGPEAGGRAGIAGSPRGWQLSEEELLNEFNRACDTVDRTIQQEYDKVLPYNKNQTPQQIMEALDKDPSCIVNVYDTDHFVQAKNYLETGVVPEGWNLSSEEEQKKILEEIARQEQVDSSHLQVNDQQIVSRTIITPEGKALDIVLGKYEDGKLDRNCEPENKLRSTAFERNEVELDQNEELDTQDSFDTQDL